MQATATQRRTAATAAGVRCRPARAAQWPATSNTPAASAISATTVIATRKTRTGPTRGGGRRARRGHGRRSLARRRVEDPRPSGPRAAPSSVDLEARPAAPRRGLRDAADVAADLAQARARPGHGCAWPCASRPGTATCTQRSASGALRAPRRGIRAGPAVDDDAAAGGRGQHLGQLGLATTRGERADAGQVDRHGQAVRRDRVGRGAARRTGRRRRRATGWRGAWRRRRASRSRGRRRARRCRVARRRSVGAVCRRVLRAMSAARLGLTPSRSRRVGLRR